MREILFRGKALYSDYWIEGYYVLLHDCKGNVSHRIYPGYAATDCGDFYPEWDEVDPKTVGQFTGLTKNGKKIFEGDLCLCNRNINSFVDNQVFLISFDAEYGQWVGSSRSSNIAADEFSMCEVIGNIHDNPELLEG